MYDPNTPEPTRVATPEEAERHKMAMQAWIDTYTSAIASGSTVIWAQRRAAVSYWAAMALLEKRAREEQP